MPQLLEAARGLLALCVLVLPVAFGQAPPPEGDMSVCKAAAGTSIYDYVVQTLDGQTNQTYRDFNTVLSRHSNFFTLAFPCNQFGLQEPASNAELLPLLKNVRPGGGWEPHVNLKIYGKLQVNGATAHLLFKYLEASCPPTQDRIGDKAGIFWTPIETNDIVWNFEKFLVDKHGVPRYRFHPRTWNFGAAVEPYLNFLLQE